MSKSRKIRLFGVSNQDTMVYLLRIIQPLAGMARQKLANVHHIPMFGQHATWLTSVEFREYQALEGKWADILYSTVGSDRYYLSVLLAIKERYKIPLVIDLDDDLLATQYEPNNPAYSSFMSGEGKHAEYAQHCIAQADMLTVSTEYLKKKYAALHPHIVVVPNCVDPRLFNQANQSTDEVVVGYAGSGSHQKDWEMVEPVLRRLKRSHGIKVKVMGPMVTDIADEQAPWTDTLKYPAKMASMGFSIGIAPLKDSAMSRAKSNLRWLEYSALKIPTVASDVVPFRGIDNVLYAREPEDWEAHLTYLIEHPEARTSLGERAYTESTIKYDLDAHARELFPHFRELHERTAAGHGRGGA